MNQQNGGRRALVLCGGGILGAAFEIGVLTACEDLAGEGSLCDRFDMFIGTSAGSFVAALVAQGITPKRLFDAFEHERTRFYLSPSDIYDVDWKRLVRGLVRFSVETIRGFLRRIFLTQKTPWIDLFSVGLKHLPVGFLRIHRLETYLCELFTGLGLSNCFADLTKPLYLPALDIDTGERTVFGEDLQQAPTICRAVTASSAIPHIFGPIEIAGRYYVDGAIGGGNNVDIAVAKGADRIFVVNPMVPACGVPPSDKVKTEGEICLTRRLGGLGSIIDQTTKIEHEILLTRNMHCLAVEHPEIDCLLIQPERTRMFREPIMEYRAAPSVLQLGYETLMEQRDRFLQTIERFQLR